MSNAALLAQFVEWARPKPSELSEENFGGDPLVREFVRVLQEQTGASFKVYVTWACPPQVAVVRCAAGNAVIRSERLDTLLVEYHRLADLAASLHEAPSSIDELTTSAVLRWMSELLLGQQAATLAITALEKKREVPLSLDFPPFRDESLASISQIQRAAIQCFSIAHEVGHIVYSRRESITFGTQIDGLPLHRHLTRDLDESGQRDDIRAQLREILLKDTSPADLLFEIEADAFALVMVVQFIKHVFQCQTAQAMEATLRACEATYALSSCMQSCRHLCNAETMVDFSQSDFVAGAAMSARGWAAMRRAGITWAQLEHPTKALTASDVGEYVPRVDAIGHQRREFMHRFAQKMVTCSQSLFSDHNSLTPDQLGTRFDQQVARLRADSELRLELFYMLVAFGCPGGTDVEAYMTYQWARQSRPNSRG
jgi:hypothetical protein